MAIIKIITNRSYSAISNYHLRDKTLSWKAKGLLSTMLSLPENWDYSTKGLQSLSADGDTSTRSVIQEVLEAGYLVRSRLYKRGKLFDWLYTIYEQPVEEEKRVCKSYSVDDNGNLIELKSKQTQQENLDVENQQQDNLQQGFQHDYININKSINKKSNKESTNIDSCAQPEVEHEIPKNPITVNDSKPKALLRNSKRTLLVESSSVVDELKTKVKQPAKTEKLETDKTEIKRTSYLNKAIEIVVTQLNLTDTTIINLVKDWLDCCYDKGVTTTKKSRFKYVVDQLQNLFNSFTTEKITKILQTAIVSSYINLDFAIQNSTKSTYNKAHTKADEYKFPGIKKDETVEEYLERTYESPEQHQQRMKEMQEKVKQGKLKSY